MDGIDIPDGCKFEHANLLTAHMFHALTRSQSMTDLLGVSASKGRTIAKILADEFPVLRGQVDKLVSFRTMTYVQANLMLCTTIHVPSKELLERTRSYQDSLEELYIKDHPAVGRSRRTIHPDHRRDLQTLLSQYYEEILTIKGASGVAKTRELKFRKSIDRLEPPPPPPPDVGDGAGSGAGRDPTRDPTPPPGASADAAAAAAASAASPKVVKKGKK